MDRMLTPHWVCTYCSILSGPDLFPRHSKTEVWRLLEEDMSKKPGGRFLRSKGTISEATAHNYIPYIITVLFSQSAALRCKGEGEIQILAEDLPPVHRDDPVVSQAEKGTGRWCWGKAEFSPGRVSPRPAAFSAGSNHSGCVQSCWAGLSTTVKAVVGGVS